MHIKQYSYISKLSLKAFHENFYPQSFTINESLSNSFLHCARNISPLIGYSLNSTFQRVAHQLNHAYKVAVRHKDYHDLLSNSFVTESAY